MWQLQCCEEQIARSLESGTCYAKEALQMACHKSFRSHLNVANDCHKRRHAIIIETYVTCYYTIPFVRTRKKERKVAALTFAVLCAQWSVQPFSNFLLAGQTSPPFFIYFSSQGA
ncbi:hypothetical protein CEXT_313101 [Caerostris extrusa]|uniref:Uncharacterized protein n=1 Tax=Caerostris extrusa TaxID=172846 RepID=A0AAV4MDE7_CAEEX|nr:hypothetical protein CEXT_313101 [Caerostris extrusa]